MKRFTLLTRYRFTLAMLLALVVVAVVTGSHGEPLRRAVLERRGFAPRDLGAWRIGRLVGSALITHGGWVFYRGLAMVAVFVGAAEHRVGFRRAAATFWGVHLATLVLGSLYVLAHLRLTGETPLGTARLPRDVGPSAGAFGCLGLALVYLDRQWRWRLGLPVAAVVAGALVLPPLSTVDPATDLIADIAHVVALALGIATAVLFRFREPA